MGAHQTHGFQVTSNFLDYTHLSPALQLQTFSMGKTLGKEHMPLCYTRITTIRLHCCGNANGSKRSKGKGNFKKNSSAGR